MSTELASLDQITQSLHYLQRSYFLARDATAEIACDIMRNSSLDDLKAYDVHIVLLEKAR